MKGDKVMFDEKTNLYEDDLVIEEAEEVIAPGFLLGD
jgi:hypothetical protein